MRLTRVDKTIEICEKGVGLACYALDRCNFMILHFFGSCTGAFGRTVLTIRLASAGICQPDERSASGGCVRRNEWKGCSRIMAAARQRRRGLRRERRRTRPSASPPSNSHGPPDSKPPSAAAPRSPEALVHMDHLRAAHAVLPNHGSPQNDQRVNSGKLIGPHRQRVDLRLRRPPGPVWGPERLVRGCGAGGAVRWGGLDPEGLRGGLRRTECGLRPRPVPCPRICGRHRAGPAAGQVAQAVAVGIDYFDANKDRMRCDLCRKRGLPVGFGIVESVCKQIVRSRFKEAGCR